MEDELGDIVTELKRYRGERVALVIARCYMDHNDMVRVKKLVELLQLTFERARSGQINIRKVGKLDNEVAILESRMTLADADALMQRLSAIVTDPEATRRHLRFNLPK